VGGVERRRREAAREVQGLEQELLAVVMCAMRAVELLVAS